MNIITVSVTVLQYKCSFNDFKEVFVRDKLKKKDSHKSNIIFGVWSVLGG